MGLYPVGIEIENFKCFGERVRIDLRPITLVFGPNSAGKSTIAEALEFFYSVLLQQPTEAFPEGVHHGDVFRRLVHQHKFESAIRLRLYLRHQGDKPPLLWMLSRDDQDAPVWVELALRDGDLTGLAIGFGDQPVVSIFSAGYDKGMDALIEPGLQYWEHIGHSGEIAEPTDDAVRDLGIEESTGLYGGSHWWALAAEHRGRKVPPPPRDPWPICTQGRVITVVTPVCAKLLSNVSVLDGYASQRFEGVSFSEWLLHGAAGKDEFMRLAGESRQRITAAKGNLCLETWESEIDFDGFGSLDRPLQDFLSPARGLCPIDLDPPKGGSRTMLHGDDDVVLTSSLNEILVMFIRDCIVAMKCHGGHPRYQRLGDRNEHRDTAMHQGILHIGPLRVIPQGHLDSRTEWAKRWSDGSEAWRRLAWPVEDSVPVIYGDGYAFESSLPTRDLAGVVTDAIGSRGELPLGFQFEARYFYELELNGEIARKLSQQGLQAITGDRGGLRPTRKELYLVDESSATRVGFTEVGSGVPQAIPIIVALQDDEASFVVIEQPELHLHPGAQGGMADLLIKGKRTPGRALLIETHSEHITLRLLRRIRETGEGFLDDQVERQLRPEELSVVYIEPTPQGPRVTQIGVDEKGEFTSEWPRGFFEERLRELF
jgi:hypothetical protein